MRFLLVLMVIAGAWAHSKDASSPESSGLLEQIKQRAIVDLASVPNYVCADSIHRSLFIPGERVYGRVNRIVNFDDQIPLAAPKLPRPTPRRERWRQHPGEVLIQIEFSQIEYRRNREPFTARLIDLESRQGKRDTKILSFGYLEGDAVVRYDPPGTATIYVSKENPVLERGVIMRWIMASERSSL